MSAPKPSLVGELMAEVAPAEQAFRSRWRLSTLARINPDLHEALVDQIRLYEISLVTGSDDEAREHSAAMVRGWRAACAALEAPLQDDDAYFVGIDYKTGLHVVIGEQQASKGRVQVRDDRKVIFMTPDELATLVAGIQIIAEAKSVFPDAEVIQLYPEYGKDAA